MRNDAVLFVHAWRAATAGDAMRLRDVAELAARRADRVRTAAGSDRAGRRVPAGSTVDTAPSAVGRFAAPARMASTTTTSRLSASPPPPLFACHGIALRPALTAWLHGAVANLVSAAARLVPLGQTDGQRVLRGAARRRSSPTSNPDWRSPDDDDPFDALGGCALLAEIGCMAHETQYTRLFRT